MGKYFQEEIETASREKIEQIQTDGLLDVVKRVYENVPFEMPEVLKPVFPDYQVNIRDFGAKSGGKELCTEAINEAIRTVHKRGGGTVVIPAGLWLTGPIVLLSNVNLHTEQNALVTFSNDYSLYPIIDTSFEGSDGKRCQSPISALNAENIAVTGQGVFDGAGDKWRPVKKMKMTDRQWNALVKSGGEVDKDGKIWYPDAGALKASVLMSKKGVSKESISTDEWEEMKAWLRPVMVSIRKSKKVLLEGVTFKNSPAWCIHPLSCESLTVNDVKVFNPWYSQNGDALDVESCNRVVIYDCVFDAGDDAICIKSGKDKEGRMRGWPCQNVIARNNVVYHGHGGFVVGSEMSGGVKNIFIDNCTFIGTDVGIRFKSTRGRGGIVANIYCNRINMFEIANENILFDLYYGVKNSDNRPVPVDEGTPQFRNIYISDVKAIGGRCAMLFNGLPEMPINNINLKNIYISGTETGAIIRQSENVQMENVTIAPKNQKSISLQNVKKVSINGKSIKSVGEKEKIMD